MQEDLVKIKKYYGEDMMHLCKTLFPTVLEKDGFLFRIISSKFAYSKLLYQDLVKQDKIIDFQNYILSFFERDYNIIESNLDPFYLMDKAGYTLYECHDEDEVRKFKPLYHPSEELCTFYDNKTRDHYVFFAVKKNVSKIKRENFKIPDRQDEYGTSVISIQFTKGKYNNLSIKNRYNHSVDNPDATFSNNLDNIIPGLTDSFRKRYNLNIFFTDFEFELDNYCQAKDGKFYKYNYAINDVYYGCNNVIIDIDKITTYDKEKYIILDYFIIDLVNKKILSYKDNIKDGFLELPEIKKIRIIRNNDGKNIIISTKNDYINIKINKNNQIISIDANIEIINNDFLQHNKTLNNFTDNYLKKAGDNFLGINNCLSKLNLPNLETVGDYFISENTMLNEFDFPKLKTCGTAFLRCSNKEKISLPNLEVAGNSFFSSNHIVNEIYLPNLKEVGTYFINYNSRLKTLYAPKLERVGHHFLTRNTKMEEINLPSLIYVDDYFMYNNTCINKVNLPNVTKIGHYFLQQNYALKNLSLPNVLEIGDNFLDKNRLLENINLPSVVRIDNYFMQANDHLKILDLPNLIIIGNYFLLKNNIIEEVSLPNLKICGCYILSQTKKIKVCKINSHIHKGKYLLDSYYESLSSKEQKQLVKIFKN